MLRDSTVVVVRTRPRAIRLAKITTRKLIHGFSLVSYMGMYGAPLGALRAAGAPLKLMLCSVKYWFQLFARSYYHLTCATNIA